MKVKFAYRENGAPELQVVNEKTGQVTKRSEPVSYQGIAVLNLGNDKMFIAAGAYFAGTLTPGMVYRIYPQVAD